MSLRDVQRLLDVANWFYKQRRYLFPAIDEVEEVFILDDDDEEEEDTEPVHGQVILPIQTRNITVNFNVKIFASSSAKVG